MNKKGKLIVIEGSDGCGKETQSKLLTEYLENKGISVLRLSFPLYDELSSGPVREYLSGKLGPKEDLTINQISMIYAVDRLCAIKKYEIEKKLNDGVWVICDRYTESNIIYQAARSIPGESVVSVINAVLGIEYVALKIPYPDMVFYLSLDRSISKELIRKRNESSDIHESDDVYLQKVSSVGLELANALKWNIIDCNNEAKDNIREKNEILKDIVYLIENN